MTLVFKTTQSRMEELSGTPLMKRIEQITKSVIKRDTGRESFAKSVLLHLFEQNPGCSDSYAAQILSRRLAELQDDDDE